MRLKSLMTHLPIVVNGVHENKGIDCFQRPVLPCGHLRHDLFCDLCHQFWRYLYIVQFLDLLCYVPLAHATGIQGKDLLFHAIRIAAVLTDNFGGKGTVPVTGGP